MDDRGAFDTTMIKQFIFCVSLLTITGCLGPERDEYDREKYSDSIAWEKARIVDKGGSSELKILEIGPGSKIILEFTEGFSHGRRTTAHGSHESVYFILDELPRKGSSYEFSFLNGSLEFDGWAGDDSLFICRDKPAKAYLHIKDISEEEIIADVTCVLWYQSKSFIGNVPFDIKRTITFDRKNTLKVEPCK